ncbi:MAG TPA: helix-turn-helix domain-containing protein [Methylophilaceae bacterium]|jgi:transcriptional regulator with XRE-family HTH domain
MNNIMRSIEDFEFELGEQVRNLRIKRELDQKGLASNANISLGALMNLENGRGSTLKTMIKVLRILGREDWLLMLSPQSAISPLAMLRDQKKKEPRRKVFRPRAKKV